MVVPTAIANHVWDNTNMESVDKSQKWTKVLFHSTDAVEVTETAGNGKPIRGVRKLKAGEEPHLVPLSSRTAGTMNIVKSAGNISIPATMHTEASTISGSASVALREPKPNEGNGDVTPADGVNSAAIEGFRPSNDHVSGQVNEHRNAI
jgi:hypothetical protein